MLRSSLYFDEARHVHATLLLEGRLETNLAEENRHLNAGNKFIVLSNFISCSTFVKRANIIP